MRSADTQSRALGVLAFVLAHVVGFVLLWAVGPAHLEMGAMIIIACDFVILARATSGDRALLLPLLFAIVFALFHFSLLPIAVLNPQFLYLHPYFSLWYFSPFTAPAYWVALVFFVFVIAGALITRRLEEAAEVGQAAVAAEDRRSDILLLIFAGLIAYFFIAVFFILGISGYAQYNEVARSGSLGWVAGSLILLYPMIGAMAMLCADRVRSLKLFGHVQCGRCRRLRPGCVAPCSSRQP